MRITASILIIALASMSAAAAEPKTTYPGVEVLADGTFVTTTYGHWSQGESPYILSVRLKLDELDALAKPE